MLLPISPSERPSVQAPHAVRRVAQAPLAEQARPAHAPSPPSLSATPSASNAAIPPNPDLLRDHYADDRVRKAVEAFQASDPTQAACMGAAWGTVDCLQPLQRYFVVHAEPPLDAAAATMPLKRRRLAVTDIKNAALDEGFEKSRQGRQQTA